MGIDNDSGKGFLQTFIESFIGNFFETIRLRQRLPLRGFNVYRVLFDLSKVLRKSSPSMSTVWHIS